MAWSFIGIAGSAIGFTGDAISVTFPETILENDLLHLTILHRSSLTPPTGWTLVDVTEVITEDYPQYTSVYVKSAEGTDASSTLNLSQADSARFEAWVSVFRPSTGSWFLVTGSTEKGSVVLPPLSLEGSSSYRGLAVFACTHVFSSSSTQYTFSSNLTRIIGSSNAGQRRLGVAYQTPTEVTDTYTASVNVTGDVHLGGVLAFFTESEDPAPSRVNQLLTQVAVKGEPAIRVNQLLLQVAVKIPPEESPSRVNQLLLQVAVRRRNRRVVAMAD